VRYTMGIMWSFGGICYLHPQEGRLASIDDEVFMYS
jgi:hypothetical protein